MVTTAINTNAVFLIFRPNVCAQARASSHVACSALLDCASSLRLTEPEGRGRTRVTQDLCRYPHRPITPIAIPMRAEATHWMKEGRRKPPACSDSECNGDPTGRHIDTIRDGAGDGSTHEHGNQGVCQCDQDEYVQGINMRHEFVVKRRSAAVLHKRQWNSVGRVTRT